MVSNNRLKAIQAAATKDHKITSKMMLRLKVQQLLLKHFHSPIKPSINENMLRS